MRPRRRITYSIYFNELRQVKRNSYSSYTTARTFRSAARKARAISAEMNEDVMVGQNFKIGRCKGREKIWWFRAV